MSRPEAVIVVGRSIKDYKRALQSIKSLRPALAERYPPGLFVKHRRSARADVVVICARRWSIAFLLGKHSGLRARPGSGRNVLSRQFGPTWWVVMDRRLLLGKHGWIQIRGPASGALRPART